MLDLEIILENDRIRLRPILLEDLDGLLSLTAEPNMWKYFTHDLSTPEGLREWLQPALQKDRYQFVVIDKVTGDFLGSTAFGNISERDLRLEIGWTWLGASYQGAGINSQMKQLMLTYCFEVLKLERVEFKTDVLNIQARTALKNIWAIEEGVLRSHTLMTNGRRRDTLYFSILKDEWPFVKRENGWT